MMIYDEVEIVPSKSTILRFARLLFGAIPRDVRIMQVAGNMQSIKLSDGKSKMTELNKCVFRRPYGYLSLRLGYDKSSGVLLWRDLMRHTEAG